MRATAIELDEQRATVLLRPSWLGRLFGARAVVIELEWHPSAGITSAGWYAVASRRRLDELEHREIIRDALDFRPVAPVPSARQLR